MTSLTPRQARSAVDVRVTTRGAVSPAAPGYARAKVLVLLGRAHEPVLAARVKLSQESHHTVARPSVAQAMVDLLQDRLKVQLAKARQRHHAPRGERADRCGDGHRPEHAVRPERAARPAGERRVVRHKAYSLSRQNAWAAVLDLEALDYDFHLFTDAASGSDSVVYRDERTGTHHVASAGRPADPVPGLTVSTAAVPELTVAEAAERLDLTGQPFVFFTDTASGRGTTAWSP